MNNLIAIIPIALAFLLLLASCQRDQRVARAVDAARTESESPGSVSVKDPDRSDIMDLIYRYSHTVDARDVEGFVSLFTEDCRFVAHLAENPITLDSRVKLREYVTGRIKYFADQGIQTRHLQTNTFLTQIKTDLVQGATYITVTGQAKGDAAPRLISTGIYRDQFVRTTDGWRFAVRETFLDAGKLPSVGR